MSTTAEELDLAELDELRTAHQQIREQIARQIVGQDEVVEQLLIAVFARGHCLLEGVPGLAKTLMIALAGAVALAGVQPHPVHARPDALGHHRHRDPPGGPGDRRRASSGSSAGRSSPTSSWPTRSTARRPRRRPPCWRRCRSGRSPSAGTATRCPTRSSSWPRRTRSSRRGRTRCPRRSSTGSCSRSSSTTRRPRRSGGSTGSPPAPSTPEITPLIAGERIAALQRLVRRVPVADHCIDYALDLVRATRGPEHGGPDFVGEWVAWGAGPRAGQSLILAAKARAALGGRPSVSDRRHPGRRPARAPPPDRHQLQRPGRRRVERLDRQAAAGRRPGPQGSRRCRRRGRIPILTPSRRSRT